MALLRIHNLSISFGGPLLLDGASLQIEAGERIGLLGRNGSGKSTLLKALQGDLLPDSGEIARDKNVRLSLMPQEVPEITATVYDVVASGGKEHLDLLHAYADLTGKAQGGNAPRDMKSLEKIQHQMEATGVWGFSQKIETVLSRTGLDGQARFESLSAGLKRRVLLARALVKDPDILLLDEPTNHLDLDAIVWLEDFLQNFDKTLMFVTHDRTFLQKIATRIVEIDRGKLLSFTCAYATYLERRQALLDAQESQWQTFDKKLAKEEAWIRQGIKARRTRNEGRVRALVALRRERADRREREGSVKLAVSEAQAGGKLVVEASGIGFAWGDTQIIDNFSTRILRGDRIGIIGPNGSGKTTLLKVLLGELPVSSGQIRLGTNIAIAYFDQLRAQFDETKSIRDNVASGNDTLVINGLSRHVVGYLQDFLFSPDQIAAPVSTLSGGEKNRLLLARLFAIPSNVLVMDEPTNDLDAETLELLEERLADYAGTILLVSHDRTFLNNVVTSTMVKEGNGRWCEYIGGYDDWVRQKSLSDATRKATPGDARLKKEKAPKEKSKLSFKEIREREELPVSIERLEKTKLELLERLNSPDLYKTNDPKRLLDLNDRLADLEAELDAAYERWDALEEMAQKYST